jgi:hypothetical protein
VLIGQIDLGVSVGAWDRDSSSSTSSSPAGSASLDQALSQRFAVDETPLLRVYRDGIGEDVAYQRDLLASASHLAEFVQRQSGPASKPVSSLIEVAYMLDGATDVVVAGYFRSPVELRVFRNVAQELRNEFVFMEVTSPSLLTELGYGQVGGGEGQVGGG